MKDAKGHGSNPRGGAAHQTGVADAVGPAQVQRVPVGSIVNAWDAANMAGQTTNEYRAKIRSGERTAPVQLMPHSPGKYWILDGHHRLAAHKAEGKSSIEAFVHPRSTQ